MKSPSEDIRDPQLAEILQDAPSSVAPQELVDKLMLAVEAEALRRQKIRQNLRWALLGVGSTLALMLGWLFAGSGWVQQLIGGSSRYSAELSQVVLLGVTFVGMLALFVELELVVRYWGSLRRKV